MPIAVYRIILCTPLLLNLAFLSGMRLISRVIAFPEGNDAYRVF